MLLMGPKSRGLSGPPQFANREAEGANRPIPASRVASLP